VTVTWSPPPPLTNPAAPLCFLSDFFLPRAPHARALCPFVSPPFLSGQLNRNVAFWRTHHLLGGLPPYFFLLPTQFGDSILCYRVLDYFMPSTSLSRFGPQLFTINRSSLPKGIFRLKAVSRLRPPIRTSSFFGQYDRSTLIFPLGGPFSHTFSPQWLILCPPDPRRRHEFPAHLRSGSSLHGKCVVANSRPLITAVHDFPAISIGPLHLV